MRYGIGFKLALCASAFLLMASGIFCAASFAWRDDIPFEIRGVHYKLSSWHGDIIFSNAPQIALDTASARQSEAEVDVLVRQYREISDHFNGKAEAGYPAAVLEWKSQQILERIESKGYVYGQVPDHCVVLGRTPVRDPRLLPDTGANTDRLDFNTGLAPLDDSHLVLPILTDAQGKPVLLNNPQPILPVDYLVPYAAPALAATFFPALFVTRLLLRRSRRRRKICVACGYDVRFNPHRCPECGTEVVSIPTGKSNVFARPVWISLIFALAIAVAQGAIRLKLLHSAPREAAPIATRMTFPPPPDPSYFQPRFMEIAPQSDPTP